MKYSTVILLTACVDPKGMIFTTLNNRDIRKEQYIQSIKWYLNRTNLPIVIVDNSLFDFSPFFSQDIKKGRLECLAFDGNNFNANLGKGFGEGEIMRYAFENSLFIHKCKTVIKITGRYIIENLVSQLRIISFVPKWRQVVFTDTIEGYPWKHSTGCFIASKYFYEKSFLKDLLNCDDSKGMFYEVLFDNCITQYITDDNGKASSFPLMLSVKGISGTSGQEYKKQKISLRNRWRILKRFLFASFR